MPPTSIVEPDFTLTVSEKLFDSITGLLKLSPLTEKDW
jgi:hypothetical protein